jgi:hypothetical protein
VGFSNPRTPDRQPPARDPRSPKEPPLKRDHLGPPNDVRRGREGAGTAASKMAARRKIAADEGHEVTTAHTCRHTGRNMPSTFRGRTSTVNEIKDLAGGCARPGRGVRRRQPLMGAVPHHLTARVDRLESHGAPRSPERDHLGDLEPPYRPGGRRCGHRFCNGGIFMTQK